MSKEILSTNLPIQSEKPQEEEKKPVPVCVYEKPKEEYIIEHDKNFGDFLKAKLDERSVRFQRPFRVGERRANESKPLREEMSFHSSVLRRRVPPGARATRIKFPK